MSVLWLSGSVPFEKVCCVCMLSLHVESNDWSPFQYICSQIFFQHSSLTCWLSFVFFRTGLTSLSFYNLRYILTTFTLSTMYILVTEPVELETYIATIARPSSKSWNLLDFNVQWFSTYVTCPITGLWGLYFGWLSITLSFSHTIRSTALGSTLCWLPQMLLWTTMLHYLVHVLVPFIRIRTLSPPGAGGDGGLLDLQLDKLATQKHTHLVTRPLYIQSTQTQSS